MHQPNNPRDLARKADLAPDYISLVAQYAFSTCPITNQAHTCDFRSIDVAFYLLGSPLHRVCTNRSSASGRLLRSTSVVREWNEEHGQLYGTPAGLQVDHIVPLCLGGPDCRCNFQYITEEDHKTKTRRDLAACRFYDVML